MHLGDSDAPNIDGELQHASSSSEDEFSHDIDQENENISVTVNNSVIAMHSPLLVCS